MTVIAQTCVSSKAWCAAAALLAGLAVAPAQAAAARQERNDLGRVVENKASYVSNGTSGVVGDLNQAAASTGSVNERRVRHFQISAQEAHLMPQPSLLWVAALGALCLSLSWRRPASRHAEKLRQRLGSAEATTSAQG
jgi:hypothetical protein